ncbi:MAG: SPOR domain-containing protein [Legionella longbeachae]|nr:SPOR domain-containing protein [Legionella longbeachae]
MKEGLIQSGVPTVIQPRVLFKPGSWLAKIDFINHLILFNNVLITVLSEKEGGKTSFGTLLQSNLDQQIKSVSMKVKASCTREQIIDEIASQFNLNHDESNDIATIVTQINERKAHVLLLIDDAQHLPESLIKETMLAIKNQENFGFFHLCFISDYSIVATLNHLNAVFSDSLVHTLELGALNENETRTYVLQRAMAAHLITKPLSDAQFNQFYHLTKGNVAKINHTLEDFVIKCSSQKKNDPVKKVKKASIAASVVIAAGLVGFYFFQSYKTDITPVQNESTAMQPEVLVSHIASWEESSTRQWVYSSLPKKQTLEYLDDEVPGAVAIIDKVVVIPKVQTKHLMNDEPKILEPVVLEPIVLAPKLASEIKPLAISKINPNKQHKIIQLKAHTNLYTIQIAASHNKNDIERFKHKNKLLNNGAKLRHFTNEQGVWYVLTVGEYESQSQARDKMRRLPTSLAKLNPWVRPISTLLNKKI